MKESQPLKDSASRVLEALTVVQEWHDAVTRCVDVVTHSEKREKDGRLDLNPAAVLPTIRGLRDVCTDLSNIITVVFFIVCAIFLVILFLTFGLVATMIQ